MSTNIELRIASEFSKRLGARYRYEGQYSGQEFLETLLEPRFIQAKDAKVKLMIYLDGGVLGYPSSFVSGSFGKLSISYGYEEVLKVLNFVSDKKIRIEKIEMEIKSPKRK